MLREPDPDSLGPEHTYLATTNLPFWLAVPFRRTYGLTLPPAGKNPIPVRHGPAYLIRAKHNLYPRRLELDASVGWELIELNSDRKIALSVPSPHVNEIDFCL